MGFNHCLLPELEKVREVWVAHFLKGDYSYRGYECWYGLKNYAFPLILDQGRRPVGALIVGQILESEEGRERGLARIEQLALPAEKKSELSTLLRSSLVPSATQLQQTLQAAEGHARFLSEYMSERAERLRGDHELQLIRAATRIVSGYSDDDIDNIHKNLGRALEELRTFCRFRRIIALLSRPGSDYNILRFATATPDAPEFSQEMHYNWRRGGVLGGNGHRQLSSTNITLIQRGLKKTPVEYAAGLSGFVSYSMATGPKALLIAEGGPPGVSLENYRPFFDNIAKSIVRTVLTDIQGVALRETVDFYRHQMKTGSHHMMDALTNSQFTLGYLMKRVEASEALNFLRPRLGLIEQSISHAFAITRRTLKWERETPGRLYEFSLYSLEDLVLKSVEMKKDYARHRGVELKVLPGVHSLPAIPMDREMLQMAVNCVLDNAAKYSHPDKIVFVDGSVTSRNVILSIEDFGLGISDEDKSRIYDYEYGSKKRGKSAKEPMHGIGLSFASDVVHSHDGLIRFEQSSGKRGSVSRELEGYRVKFFIELPRRDSE
jgi:signal transduction histidine kinase